MSIDQRKTSTISERTTPDYNNFYYPSSNYKPQPTTQKNYVEEKVNVRPKRASERPKESATFSKRKLQTIAYRFRLLENVLIISNFSSVTSFFGVPQKVASSLNPKLHKSSFVGHSS
ncbi:unnamed protein product [Ceratitis capitata]|uniref:(Mediterranean fruit fly) hypothetical protein n=1 Tax=Ceratitis capitata TaxID=7213 RepID=A0A811VDQ8_CERCA|nr:unnamed protein product [Ceratitis capitata]